MEENQKENQSASCCTTSDCKCKKFILPVILLVVGLIIGFCIGKCKVSCPISGDQAAPTAATK